MTLSGIFIAAASQCKQKLNTIEIFLGKGIDPRMNVWGYYLWVILIIHA